MVPGYLAGCRGSLPAGLGESLCGVGQQHLGGAPMLRGDAVQELVDTCEVPDGLSQRRPLGEGMGWVPLDGGGSRGIGNTISLPVSLSQRTRCGAFTRVSRIASLHLGKIAVGTRAPVQLKPKLYRGAENILSLGDSLIKCPFFFSNK